MRDENKRLGIDTEFSTQKHAYVLTFPWNFDEIINQFESQNRGVSAFWKMYTDNSGCKHKFNELFREFHQSCARNDTVGIKHVCEGRLAQAVNESMDRIHFHGLDLEMANLTAEPNIRVLKVEVNHGLNVDRSQNGNAEDWAIAESSIQGAQCNYYTPVPDNRSMLDSIEDSRKPYVVAVTCLIESPMKLFVYNQNCSKILLGSDNQEMVKNVVRFEANLAWNELLDVMPTQMKPPKEWIITDYNNLMNENPFFRQ